jgi:hypothetical protein
MSKNQSNKREIVRLDEVPRPGRSSSTPESKRPRSSRSTSKKPSGISEEARVATPARVTHSADRGSEPMGPRVAEPDGGPDRAVEEEARVMDSPARVSHSADRSRTPVVLFNSINGDAYKGASWSRVLPCWLTGGPCMVERIWTGRPRLHPRRGLVVNLVNEQDGRADPTRVFMHSQAVRLSRLKGLIQGIPPTTR